MTPFAILRSSRARADLVDIWLYLAERSVLAADRVLDEIERVCGVIANYPEIGRARPEISRGLRSFVAMSWVVFYRIEDGTIRIVRVIHGARDLDAIDF
jgi:toxin ParE1/3/4